MTKFYMFKLITFADDNSSLTEIVRFVFNKLKNTLGTGKK